MRLLRRSILVLIAATLLLGGCAHYHDNPELQTIDPQAGYRYSVVRGMPSPDRPFVLLSFSGGGTRAAAFAFGLMEELSTVEYADRTGAKHRLLDDVEIISSVSGGSFASAYYALFPDTYFRDFPRAVLYRNIQRALFLRLFNPYNWVRFLSPNFSRIDMADEYYNKEIFKGKTFADLIANRTKHVPFLVLNATDIAITHQFEFTQDQFDLLCSDLSRVDVSRAVAASSNFPVAFAPLTLDIYNQKSCGPLPGWITSALKDDRDPGRRYYDARAAESYRDSDRRFAHLLDGGLSDNLGLRGPYEAVTTTDSPWSILRYANLSKLKTLMIIAANAKTTKNPDWDKKSSPPGIGAVLDVTLNGPMDDVSLDSTEMIKDHFRDMQQLHDTVAACNTVLGQRCPAAAPIDNPIATAFTFAELSFDHVRDAHLRQCLQALPTSFSLPKDTVDLLRQAAAQLLETSQPFIAGMRRLDPTWQPRTVVIDPQLIERVCGR